MLRARPERVVSRERVFVLDVPFPHARVTRARLTHDTSFLDTRIIEHSSLNKSDAIESRRAFFVLSLLRLAFAHSLSSFLCVPAVDRGHRARGCHQTSAVRMRATSVLGRRSGFRHEIHDGSRFRLERQAIGKEAPKTRPLTLSHPRGLWTATHQRPGETVVGFVGIRRRPSRSYTLDIGQPRSTAHSSVAWPSGWRGRRRRRG